MSCNTKDEKQINNAFVVLIFYFKINNIFMRFEKIVELIVSE